jgi:hypothetical protein
MLLLLPIIQADDRLIGKVFSRSTTGNRLGRKRPPVNPDARDFAGSVSRRQQFGKAPRAAVRGASGNTCRGDPARRDRTKPCHSCQSNGRRCPRHPKACVVSPDERRVRPRCESCARGQAKSIERRALQRRRQEEQARGSGLFQLDCDPGRGVLALGLWIKTSKAGKKFLDLPSRRSNGVLTLARRGRA